MKRSLVEKVRRRAKDRCEYCGVPSAADPFWFHVDHIIARQHRGKAAMANLAWACANCNAKKGPNIAGVDPSHRQIVRLYNPRRDRWSEHFRWRTHRIVGASPIDRATVVVLGLNEPIRVEFRRSLDAENLMPTAGTRE